MASTKILLCAFTICFALIIACEGQRRRPKPRPDVQALKDAIRQKVLEDIAKRYGVTLPTTTTTAATTSEDASSTEASNSTEADSTTAASTTAQATIAANSTGTD
ncbi:uncharacterized protein LOC131681498 [Topomyia yanbarensis]|uniref:uncharacterized protein LOC131681498 n=1 Tax=Topomyia yanbarensis TaxID=2498891 RepID=UPI00273BF704|nr:uncharacterized protein LOC131681498 [Topomyia yanbarensis]